MIGVVGAGTMGSGIAQLAAQSGEETLVFDPVEGAAARGVDRALAGIEKLRAKGRLEGEPAGLRVISSLEDFAGARVVIEVAPERLEVKHDIFSTLSRVAPEAILASNTSSIPITAIAGAAADPAKVVGMHFFNPPPLMALVEVIAGLQSSPDSVRVARELGEAMGKTVIDAADVPGFVVNRCSRPFLLEALALLREGVADVPTIDRIVRAAGFRMGPFELADLVGVDVGFAVAESFYALSFGEPRWRPSPLVARLVASGRHGRKTGEGWYRYAEGQPHRPEDPAPGEAAGGDGRLVVIAGFLPVADDLRDLADDAGWNVADGATDEIPHLIVDCGSEPDDPVLQGGPQALLLAEGALHALDPSGTACGFHCLPPVGDVIEVTAREDAHAERFEAFVRTLGKEPVRVGDAPGLVLGRIVSQLVNECAFAVGEGVAAAQDVDLGLQLGLNYPRGPLGWADGAAPAHPLLILDALHEHFGEERYRVAPRLRAVVDEGRGFHVGHDHTDDHDHRPHI